MRQYTVTMVHALAFGLFAAGCFVVAEPPPESPTPPAPSPGPMVVQPAAPTPTAATPTCMAGPTTAASVREIPWRDCTYQSSEGPVTVTNGDFVTGEEGGDLWFEFRVDGVAFGDLTGDGLEEAAVATANVYLPHGDSGALTIYGVADGILAVLGIISYRGREIDQIVDSSIVDRTILLRRHVWADEDPACCPSQERTETWRWTGSGFAEDESLRSTSAISQ